jgi:hypothetical protein
LRAISGRASNDVAMRAEDQARGKRAERQTALQEQSQAEHEAAVIAIQASVDREPGAERTSAEQREVEHRLAAAARECRLEARCEEDRERRRAEQRDHPPRPALTAPERQRDQHQSQGARDRRDTDGIELRARARAVIRQQPRGKGDRNDPDRDVDEEDRAPVPAEQIELDQHAATDLPADHPESDGDAEPTECAVALLRREQRGYQRQHLRQHQCCAAALGEAGDDQLGRCLGDAAGSRREREKRHPAEEDKAVAVAVAEASAGDQERCVGEGVAADDEL